MCIYFYVNECQINEEMNLFFLISSCYFDLGGNRVYDKICLSYKSCNFSIIGSGAIRNWNIFYSMVLCIRSH